MKVVILAGGFGSRLSEMTQNIPKPMVTIGGKPIMCHIMKTYAKYNHSDFYLALGYKSELIKDYFFSHNCILGKNFFHNILLKRLKIKDTESRSRISDMKMGNKINKLNLDIKKKIIGEISENIENIHL